MLLTSSDHNRIRQAVERAESATRAEIACVISEEASDYAEVPLIWAAALVLGAPLLPLTFFAMILLAREKFQGWAAGPAAPSHAPIIDFAFFASLQALAFLLIVLLGSIPAVRRALTPAWLKQMFVRQRALEQFLARGLVNTAERTGLLLYVSVKDKCAELIADTGVNAKVASSTWRAVMTLLRNNIRRGHAVDGLVLAIDAFGRELAKQLPAGPVNPNELPDGAEDLSVRINGV